VAVSTIEELDAQMFEASFLADPYPVFAQLRDRAPAFWSSLQSAWLITRYDDVVTVLRDSRQFSSAGFDKQFLARLPAETRDRIPTMMRRAHTRNLIGSDPPFHTLLRRHANAPFAPRLIEQLEPFILETVTRALDGATSASFDVIADLALPLPSSVIAELMGIPSDDRGLFTQWSNNLVVALNHARPDPEGAMLGERTLSEFFAYLEDAFARRRSRPGDDLISHLLQESGGEVTDDVLISTCIHFLSAGFETTTALIGNTMYALLTHPGELERIVNDRALVPRAIEEVLRWEPPIQRFRRVAVADIDIAGARIKQGNGVMAVIASGNRDPAVFDRPERFEIDRDASKHLAFGKGIHFCLGAGLARLEARIAVEQMLLRMPGLLFAEGWEPSWIDSMMIRGLVSLPVVFDE
jgi:cytochrome P450